MPDSSAIPVRRVDDAREAKVKTKVDGLAPSALPSISPAGPRKLIRPRLPAGTSPYPARVSTLSPVFTNHHRWDSTAGRGEHSHAEAFYFQKQIQSRTSMIFLLEDGERIEGIIEITDVPRNAALDLEGLRHRALLDEVVERRWRYSDVCCCLLTAEAPSQ